MFQAVPALWPYGTSSPGRVLHQDTCKRGLPETAFQTKVGIAASVLTMHHQYQDSSAVHGHPSGVLNMLSRLLLVHLTGCVSSLDAQQLRPMTWPCCWYGRAKSSLLACALLLSRNTCWGLALCFLNLVG